MQNFQNELQMLGMDQYQAGALVPMDPLSAQSLDDPRRCGGCGGCGGFRCGGFRCGGCFGGLALGLGLGLAAGSCGGCGGCYGCYSCYSCYYGGGVIII